MQIYPRIDLGIYLLVYVFNNLVSVLLSLYVDFSNLLDKSINLCANFGTV